LQLTLVITSYIADMSMQEKILGKPHSEKHPFIHTSRIEYDA
jgi:hypothetical protein